MTRPSNVPLADLIVDIRPGFASGEEDPTGVFQLRMNNVTRSGALDLTKRRRVPRNHKAVPSTLVRAGDVLFNATNSPDLVGKTAIAPHFDEPTVFSNHFLRLRTDESRLHSGYLAQWLQYQFRLGVFRSRCRQWVNQATVGREALLSLKIPLATLGEQRRIVGALDRADGLRAQRREALAHLDELAQSIFFDVFGNVATNERSWDESRLLSDVADVVSGITKGRAVGQTSTRSVPYLAVANVQDMRLDLGFVKTIYATEAEVDRYRLQRNDLLLTEGGDPDKLGRGVLWREEISECIHQNHIFRVRLKKDSNISPVFLNWLVSSARGRYYFLRCAKQTTGIASINATQLRNFPLLVPPIDVQKKFTETLSKVEQQRNSQRAHLVELDSLSEALRYRAFRGEL